MGEATDACWEEKRLGINLTLKESQQLGSAALKVCTCVYMLWILLRFLISKGKGLGVQRLMVQGCVGQSLGVQREESGGAKGRVWGCRGA